MTSPAPGDGPPAASAADRWLADARVEEAVNERRRERTRRLIAADETDVLGIVRSLSGLGDRVTVVTSTEKRTGRIRFVGADFLSIVDDDAVEILVPVSAVATIRTSAPVATTATRGNEPRLAATLADLAGDRARVQISTLSGAVVGVLEGAGTDVVVVRVQGPAGGFAHVPINAIAEVALLGR